MKSIKKKKKPISQKDFVDVLNESMLRYGILNKQLAAALQVGPSVIAGWRDRSMKQPSPRIQQIILNWLESMR